MLLELDLAGFVSPSSRPCAVHHCPIEWEASPDRNTYVTR